MTSKEIDALELAIMRAEQDAQKYADTEDGGTCNFDSPMVRIKATEKQLSVMDWPVYKYGKRHADGTTWFVISMNLNGQGNRRTRMAQAAADSLRAQGYETSLYQSMD